MITIRLNKFPDTYRYINYCDDKWYDTAPTPQYIYKDREEAMAVIEAMKRHYQRKFILEYDDGTPSEEIDTMPKPKRKGNAVLKIKSLNFSLKGMKLK